jgi:hypothetical protein
MGHAHSAVAPLDPEVGLPIYQGHERSSRRRGLACTEAALVLPVLVLFTLSIVDICNVLHLRQKIATVAFETCPPDLTATRCSSHLRTLALSSARVAVSAKSLASLVTRPLPIERAGAAWRGDS